MNRTRTAGVAGVALAGAALLGGLAVAADSGSASAAPAAPAAQVTSTGTAAPGTATSGHKAHHKRRALAGRALHGSFTVDRKGKPAVVDVQRGTVSRADATSVTVRSTDGFEATYRLVPTTHIRKDKKPVTASALPTGTKVAVVADGDGGSPAARLIRVAR